MSTWLINDICARIARDGSPDRLETRCRNSYSRTAFENNKFKHEQATQTGVMVLARPLTADAAYQKRIPQADRTLAAANSLT